MTCSVNDQMDPVEEQIIRDILIGFAQRLRQVAQQQSADTASHTAETDEFEAEITRRLTQIDERLKLGRAEAILYRKDLNSFYKEVRDFRKVVENDITDTATALKYDVGFAVVRLLKEQGIIVEKKSYKRKFENLRLEVDCLIETKDFTVVVEAKTSVRSDSLRQLAKNIESYRIHSGTKNVQGAIGGLVFPLDIRDLAKSKGYIVVLSIATQFTASRAPPPP